MVKVKKEKRHAMHSDSKYMSDIYNAVSFFPRKPFLTQKRNTLRNVGDMAPVHKAAITVQSLLPGEQKCHEAVAMLQP